MATKHITPVSVLEGGCVLFFACSFLDVVLVLIEFFLKSFYRILVVCECELYAYCTFVCVCVRECVFVCRRECACMSVCVCVSENMWQHGNNYLKYKVSLLAPGSTVLELAPVSLCT